MKKDLRVLVNGFVSKQGEVNRSQEEYRMETNWKKGYEPVKIVIYNRKKNLVYENIALIAVEEESGRILGVGKDAEPFMGGDGKISVYCPLRYGVIADYTSAEAMFRNLLNQAGVVHSVFKTGIAVCVPEDITEVESRAFQEAFMHVGGKNVLLSKESAQELKDKLPMSYSVIVDIRQNQARDGSSGSVTIEGESGSAKSWGESRNPGDKENPANRENGGSLTAVIRDQTQRALWEVKNVMDGIPDTMWEKRYGDMPLWKHVYHMLHSLDLWYINPRDGAFREPDFHEEDLNNLDVVSDAELSRAEMEGYYEQIQVKINQYLSKLSDAMLTELPEGCEYSRFTLILAQFRHLHSHMGMLMGFIIKDVGKWPRVVGLEGEIPRGEYSKYF